MKQYNYREILIERTIAVIANEGLEKATTKVIVQGTDINEAYIYRFFEDKEDLYAQTFAFVDQCFIDAVMSKIDIMYLEGVSFENRARLFFYAIWKLFTNDRNKCKVFARYYYSTYFTKYSIESYKKRYAPLVKKLSEGFREDTDVWMILKHTSSALLNGAIMVFDGELDDSDAIAEMLFNIIFNTAKLYSSQNSALAKRTIRR